ncbi:MAG: DEAD/DEAH box helicase family protein, partial [Syntrophaceticus sp.]
MNFSDMNIKSEYRSLSDNMVKDFYIPLLKNAVLYKRAVGFFSSSALIEISKGITGLVKNSGKILLIASPYLSDEDIEAINLGFELRNDVIERALRNSFTPPKNIYEEKRLNLLANLIANGQLDIKIALTESNNRIGIFHEKMGLIYDNHNNVVAFTGSMNETSTAFTQNYESIDVFCSWTMDKERVFAKESAFNAMWKNCEPNIQVVEFPEVTKEIFQQYKTPNMDLQIDIEEFMQPKSSHMITYKTKKVGPVIPDDIQLHDYQQEAINEWQNKGFVGIFDMATGTGKTYTGLGAVARLYEYLDNNLAVFIVCPYQHLVEQWLEDIEKFNMKPIVGYSASSQKDWKKRLKDAVIAFNLG